MPIQITFTSYADLWNYKDSDYQYKNPDSAFSTSALPGVAIMKKLSQLLRSGDTPEMKVEGLFRVYVEYSREHVWKWSGAGACGTPKILDGPQPPLECQAFSIGFYMLMIAKPPFGLGIPMQNVERKTYPNKKLNPDKVGFVARHPMDGVLSLKPNVHATKVADGSLVPGYYVWDNHKVVQYDGRLFDPSYGCQYGAIDDMVYLEITGFGTDGAPPTGDYNAWESAAQNDETGKCYLKCKSRQNKTYYFRMHPKSKRTVSMEYDGPLESLT